MTLAGSRSPLNYYTLGSRTRQKSWHGLLFSIEYGAWATMTFEKVSWYWYVGLLDSKTTHAQGLLKPFIPFTLFDLEPPFPQATSRWCYLVVGLRTSSRRSTLMVVTVFSQSFDTVLWFTTSRYYRREYTKFDHHMFSSHPFQKV